MLGDREMKRGGLGISGTVSALLTILLLVTGFAVSTGLLSAIYSAQSEVLRKAVNVGEAVSERLQAFVYEDVKTNRTLLTIRNVGSTGSEVEYLMAVGYDGNVLKEVKLAETVRLGTQQAYTTYLSKLLGSEFDNYRDVRSRVAVLYFKTVKGGVFGSAYMVPPSVMTAAYATSTTTLSSTQTSTETAIFPTGETTITSWTATVIVSNPDRWPVYAYVGAAFMRNIPTSVNNNGWSGSLDVGMAGFPSWGWQPGLKATDQNGQVRDVTPSDIRLPKYIACTNKNNPSSFTAWTGATRTNLLLVSFSALGPKYLVSYYDEIAQIFLSSWWYYGYQSPPNIGAVAVCGREEFIPYGMTMRIIGPTTAVFPTSTTATTRTWTSTSTYNSPSVHVVCSWYRDRWRGLCGGYQTYTVWYLVTTTITSTTTSTSIYYGTLSASRSTDVKDNQLFTFPGRIYAVTDMYFENDWSRGWYYYSIAYKLAYVKVVNYWNTTQILAYTDGSSTLYVRADRPLGIAAVYVFDGVSETRPPPPPPPPPCTEIRANPVCRSPDAEGKVTTTVPLFYEVPCGTPSDGSRTITGYTTDPTNCNGYISTSYGTVTTDQVTQCPKNGNQISCTLTSPDQFVIWDCDLNPRQK
jgi:hypothetical protein